MINQWDNMDGSVERGYSGDTIFFVNNGFTDDLNRVKDYARMLASTGINSISINNVNVWEIETYLISERFLPKVAEVAEVFRRSEERRVGKEGKTRWAPSQNKKKKIIQ